MSDVNSQKFSRGADRPDQYLTCFSVKARVAG